MFLLLANGVSFFVLFFEIPDSDGIIRNSAQYDESRGVTIDNKLFDLHLSSVLKQMISAKGEIIGF